MQPQTKYTQAGEVDIAYQVFGEGDIDLVLIPPWISQIEHLWEEPRLARMFNRLAAFARVIIFDRRGTGLSSRSIGTPTLDSQMEDVTAVMEAAGSERAAIFGHSESAALAAMYAASHPDRAPALVLFQPLARLVGAPDYPWAHSAEEREAWLNAVIGNWGSGLEFLALAPNACEDQRFMRWAGKLQRLAATPREAEAITRAYGDTDVRQILPSIRVPTLVLYRPDCMAIDHRHATYVAEHIPNARLATLEGADALFFLDDANAIVEEIEMFLTGSRRSVDTDRVLATVMFADIVGSTEQAAELGDSRWRMRLEEFYDLTERELSRFAGNKVKTTGDGFLATFDGPARAIRCAMAINDTVADSGLILRTGLHTGECEVMNGDVGGVAVHIAARVTDKARAGEVLATRTVTDLVAGSGIVFEDRGEHQLKGVPGAWQLCAARP